MNSDRIKEIQAKTAHPDSISVQQALVKVWNECEQAPSSKTNEESITLTIKELKRLCRDFSSDCYMGYVSNDELYIENWLKKLKAISEYAATHQEGGEVKKIRKGCPTCKHDDYNSGRKEGENCPHSETCGPAFKHWEEYQEGGDVWNKEAIELVKKHIPNDALAKEHILNLLQEKPLPQISDGEIDKKIHSLVVKLQILFEAERGELGMLDMSKKGLAEAGRISDHYDDKKAAHIKVAITQLMKGGEG